MNNTIITWIIFVFGLISFLPFLGTQLLMLIKPESQTVKNLLIGKDEVWRDHTHFKSARAFAWADWLVIVPLFLFGNIGVFAGQIWGYIFWIALGLSSVLGNYYSGLFSFDDNQLGNYNIECSNNWYSSEKGESL